MILRKKVQYAVFLLVVLALPLFAREEFYETDDLAHILPHIEEDTLVIFDLDNTLVRTKQSLGSDEWFVHKVQDLIQNGSTHVEAISETIAVWIQILLHSELCFVQDIAPYLIRDLQGQNISVMALTKRDPAIAERTLEQLALLEVDFSKTAPHAKSLVFTPEAGDTIYLGGVVFVASTLGKGVVFEELYKQAHKKPKKVIFIDDKKKYVDELAHSSRQLGIDYVGIRYSRADEKIQNFNPHIADMQLKKFRSILSDEEAHLLMSQMQNSESSLSALEQSKNDR